MSELNELQTRHELLVKDLERLEYNITQINEWTQRHEDRHDVFNTENEKFYKRLREGILRQENQIEWLVNKAYRTERYLLYLMIVIPIIIVLFLFR